MPLPSRFASAGSIAARENVKLSLNDLCNEVVRFVTEFEFSLKTAQDFAKSLASFIYNVGKFAFKFTAKSLKTLGYALFAGLRLVYDTAGTIYDKIPLREIIDTLKNIDYVSLFNRGRVNLTAGINKIAELLHPLYLKAHQFYVNRRNNRPRNIFSRIKNAAKNIGYSAYSTGRRFLGYVPVPYDIKFYFPFAQVVHVAGAHNDGNIIPPNGGNNNPPNAQVAIEAIVLADPVQGVIAPWFDGQEASDSESESDTDNDLEDAARQNQGQAIVNMLNNAASNAAVAEAPQNEEGLGIRRRNPRRRAANNRG